MWSFIKRVALVIVLVFAAIIGLIWLTDDNPHKRRRH